MAGRRADRDRCNARARGEGEDLTDILSRAEEMAALHRDQRELATHGNRCGCATLLILDRAYDRAAIVRVEGVAHAHWHIAFGQRDQCARMQHFSPEPRELRGFDI